MTETSPNGAECSRSAIVIGSSRVPNRKTAVVIAEDPGSTILYAISNVTLCIIILFLVTGSQLRCDVIVDRIESIAIETTTHELYLDDSPEEFVIRAMNDEG